MSQDFTTTLRLQLREAAEREARRGALRRRMPERRVALVAAALAAAAVVVGLVVSLVSPPTETVPAHAGPRVVTRVDIADQGGDLSSGFGSLWATDTSGAAVVRLNLTGSVAARVAIPGNLIDAYAGAGSVWAVTDDHVYRIDPRTNAIVARIPLPPPTRNYGAVLPFADAVWVLNSGGMLQIDLQTNRIGRKVTFERAGQAARGFAGDPRAIYVRWFDGTLSTLDRHTGREVRNVKPQVDGNPFSAARGIVYEDVGAGVAAVDSRTGKLLWRTNLGTSRVNAMMPGPGALWIQGTPVSGRRDLLWQLDAKTGRVTASLPLSDFGVGGIALTPGRLWILSPGGTLTGFAKGPA
jgi:outer membrane protein assembly factor BamB